MSEEFIDVWVRIIDEHDEPVKVDRKMVLMTYEDFLLVMERAGAEKQEVITVPSNTNLQ